MSLLDISRGHASGFQPVNMHNIFQTDMVVRREALTISLSVHDVLLYNTIVRFDE